MEIRLKEVQRLGDPPPLLTFADGSPVTAEGWERRREELIGQAVGLQFGGLPPEPEFLEVEPVQPPYEGVSAYQVATGRRERPITFTMMLALPGGKEGFPVIIDGDRADPYGRMLPPGYPPGFGTLSEKTCRVVQERGAALVTFDRQALAPDGPCPRDEALYGVYPGEKFGALAAWAWGYHRTADALVKLGIGDPEKLVFTGHSRGGKTALLAGAMDPRAKIVNPAGSGCGGMGMYRVHFRGYEEDSLPIGSFVQPPRNETLEDILGMFPFWFNEELQAYAGKEAELPFDQHWLAALAAPRWLLSCEAAGDPWANPPGTLETLREAKPAFSLLGAGERILARWRLGGHSHNVEDFTALLDLMDHVFSGAALGEDFQVIPSMPQTDPV